MKVAIEGCCHGELDAIYQTIEHLERQSNTKVDLLLICGDFQSVRNHTDMNCMAVPPKFRKMNTFYKYYSGEKVAPVLTVFIGGNHEASNYLQSLPYGGWVAPNIYYLGYAGVVQFGGVRIGGMSGIYKGKDYMRGHHEHPPYTEETKRSAYHLRNLDVFRLKQLQQHVDIFLSHDWPRGIHRYGNVERLLKRKQFFREEVESNTLGNPIAEDLLHKMKPSFWFSAHLHVKFPALVQHTGESSGKVTRFLALDKCLPRRQFLQVLDIPHDPSKPMKLELDAEWLAILKSTNHLLSLTRSLNYPASQERCDFVPSEADVKAVRDDFGGNLLIPDNFTATAPAYNPAASGNKKSIEATTEINPQTTLLCSMLDLTDPNAVFLGKCSTFDLPDDVDNTTEDKDDDAVVSDDDYESEASFVSLTGNDSFSSYAGNDSGLVNDQDCSHGNGKPNIGKSKINMKLSTQFEGCDDDDDAEFKEIMALKKSGSLNEANVLGKVELSRNGTLEIIGESKISEKAKISDEERREKMATERKKSLNLSTTELPLFLRSSSVESGSTSFTDSGLDCRSLDISDDDPELQEMLKLQRSMSSDVGKSDGTKENVKENDTDIPDDDPELQEMLKLQRGISSEAGKSSNVKEQANSADNGKDAGGPVTVEGKITNNGDGQQKIDSVNISDISSSVGQQKQQEVDVALKSPAMKKFKRRNQSFYTESSSVGEES